MAHTVIFSATFPPPGGDFASLAEAKAFARAMMLAFGGPQFATIYTPAGAIYGERKWLHNSGNYRITWTKGAF